MVAIDVGFHQEANGKGALYDIGCRGPHQLIAIHNGCWESDDLIRVIDRDWPVHIVDVRPEHTDCIWRLNHHCNEGVSNVAQMQLVKGFIHHVEMVQWANYGCDPAIMSIELQRNGEFVVYYANYRQQTIRKNAYVVASVMDILRFVAGDLAWEELRDEGMIVRSEVSLKEIIKKIFMAA